MQVDEGGTTTIVHLRPPLEGSTSSHDAVPHTRSFGMDTSGVAPARAGTPEGEIDELTIDATGSDADGDGVELGPTWQERIGSFESQPGAPTPDPGNGAGAVHVPRVHPDGEAPFSGDVAFTFTVTDCRGAGCNAAAFPCVHAWSCVRTLTARKITDTPREVALGLGEKPEAGVEPGDALGRPRTFVRRAS